MQKHKIEKLFDLGNGLWLAKAHLDSLVEQTVNARVMSKEMIEQLATTMRHRKYLESLPYCHQIDDYKAEIISGHHRARSARMAEILTIYILLDTNKLSRDEVTARQLAHNSIQGVDDKEMLKRLFEQIQDVDLKIESFIQPIDISITIESPDTIMDIAPEIDFHTISLTFLPHQRKNFDDIIERYTGDEKGIYVVQDKLFEEFKRVVNDTKRIENIKSVGMAIARMCEIVNNSNKEKEKPKQ